MPKKRLLPAPTQPSMPVELVARKIYFIRGQKVMLDSDLAELYEIETFNLNKAVKRNLDRFPDDFMFRLAKEEAESSEIPDWNVKTQWPWWAPPPASRLH